MSMININKIQLKLINLKIVIKKKMSARTHNNT